MKKCRECDKLNWNYCYPTAPPKFDCKVTGQCHFLDDVCDVKEEMDKQDKPRLAEVLGVEVGETFKVEGVSVRFFVSEDGMPKIYDGDSGLNVEGMDIYEAINHPESIIRLPRLTGPELAIMRAVGAKWVSRDANGDDGRVCLWERRPSYCAGIYEDNETEMGYPIAQIYHGPELFPSVQPGDCIELEDAE